MGSETSLTLIDPAKVKPTMQLVRPCFASLVLLALTCLSAQAEYPAQVIVPETAKTDRAIPLAVQVTVPKEFADVQVVELRGSGEPILAQLTKPGLGIDAPDPLSRELHFVLTSSATGKQHKLEIVMPESGSDHPGFAWKDEKGKHMDLVYGDRPVLRYMYEAVDNSSEPRRQETMKVYHHLFDPSGEHLLTKGPGGLFQHHRGIFYGFNKISYTQDGEKKSADVWHCNKGESQTHEAFVSQEAGPVFARQLLKVNWNGRDGKPFATELREISTYHVEGVQVVNFTSQLESQADGLKLDGDPQHAGFQFRATQHVPDETKSQTYYVRPDGKGKPGKFRNWPGDKEHVDLPWLALSFVAFDQRYTCCYLDHPENPKPARFSERDYGRFGSYFATEVAQDEPLELNYRLWLESGELKVDRVEQLRDDFVTPPEVALVKKS